MFPLAHWYFGKQLNGGRYDPLFVLGGTLPDLGRSMGLDRNEAHNCCCRRFYHFTKTAAPECIPAALGMLGHGIDPHCVDYYADEAWQDGCRGWCFQQGEAFIPQVIQACALPEKWGLWKCHNFVEMACELEIEATQPEISQEILRAVADEEAIAALSRSFSRCFGLEEANVSRSLHLLPQIFAIHQPTPQTLGEKYQQSLWRIHQIPNGDAPAIAAVIAQVRAARGSDFWRWAQEIIPLCTANLQGYLNQTAQE